MTLSFVGKKTLDGNGLWALSSMGREVKKDEVVQNTQVRDNVPSERG